MDGGACNGPESVDAPGEMTALVSNLTLNSSHAYLTTARKGALSTTEILLERGDETRQTKVDRKIRYRAGWRRILQMQCDQTYVRYGSFGSDASVILNVTLLPEGLGAAGAAALRAENEN
jgi:hypothetical protein